MSKTTEVFKAYDIRGVYPYEINADLGRNIGRAFSIFIKRVSSRSERVVIGRDMRESGKALFDSFAAGVMDQGLNVVDIGLASTDMCYFASGHFDCPAAMITASHNPSEYNGFKLCLSNAKPIGQNTGLEEISKIVEQTPKAGPELGKVENLDILETFASHVCSFIDKSKIRPLKVVADTANGMGGLILPPVFEKLPCELEILFPELDGSFPNHPADPIQIENLEHLRRHVLKTGADIGLAFDGDADRVFLVDGSGEPVSGSLTTALIADRILQKENNGTVIYNLICSKVVPEVIRERGGRAVRSRVGHSFIKELMEQENAVFAGEHSGHYYFRENFRADSGIIAALIVLEAMSQEECDLSEILAPFKRYVGSGEINFVVPEPEKSIALVAENYSDYKTDLLDGLTVESDNWWFNLRPSNTEPLLRLNLEADHQHICNQLLTEVRTLLSQ